MASFQWFTELTTRERRTLYAGFGGYAVDAFDFMIYSFLIPTLIVTWGMTKSEAGLIATSSLISSAIGGWIAGILADRYGRVRVLSSCQNEWVKPERQVKRANVAMVHCSTRTRP